MTTPVSDTDLVRIMKLAEDLKAETANVPMLQCFAFSHLPPHLQAVSAAFAEMALVIINGSEENPERSTALRKLLECKDAAVRARLWKWPTPLPDNSHP